MARTARGGPRRGEGQVIGFYFKLHFVLAEVGWWERRGPQEDYISAHTWFGLGPGAPRGFGWRVLTEGIGPSAREGLVRVGVSCLGP